MKAAICRVSRQSFYGLVALTVAACGGGNSGGDGPVDPVSTEFPIVANQIPTDNLVPDSERRVIPTAEVVPFRSDSPYASVLKECALATEDTLCTNATLPYIGQEHTNPTINDILNRVLVSHDWMGVRFAQLLQLLPEESIALFKPVTVITIGSEVRPSVFNSWRGSIELDPYYLWLTLTEKRTISVDDDPRLAFGADLRFLNRWSYMKDNQRAYQFFSLSDDEERTLNDSLLPAASLLYHELAHANDFVNPDFFPEINPEATPRDMLDTFASRRVSEVLQNNASLSVQRSWLFGLAAVRFFDDEPNDDLLAFTPESAGAVMGNEGKPFFYSYSTIREDMATLFETAMMKKHFNVELHTAYVEKPAGYPEDYSCEELLIGWGEGNRLAAPLVVPRAKFVIDQVLGETAVNENFFANGLGNAAPLPVGDHWCNIIFPEITTASSRKALTEKLETDLYREQWRSVDHIREQ